MSSKTSKISKKVKTDADQKVMHMMYLYLQEKGLTEDFKKFSAKAQDKGLSKVKYTRMELLKMKIIELCNRMW